MPESLFSICFDHVDACPVCDYGERRLCPTGRRLFDAAHEACRRMAGVDVRPSDEDSRN
jgi:hypothetical protein